MRVIREPRLIQTHAGAIDANRIIDLRYVVWTAAPGSTAGGFMHPQATREQWDQADPATRQVTVDLETAAGAETKRFAGVSAGELVAQIDELANRHQIERCLQAIEQRPRTWRERAAIAAVRLLIKEGAPA